MFSKLPEAVTKVAKSCPNYNITNPMIAHVTTQTLKLSGCKPWFFCKISSFFANFSGEKNPNHPDYDDDADGSFPEKEIEEFKPSHLIGL